MSQVFHVVMANCHVNTRDSVLKSSQDVDSPASAYTKHELQIGSEFENAEHKLSKPLIAIDNQILQV